MQEVIRVFDELDIRRIVTTEMEGYYTRAEALLAKLDTGGNSQALREFVQFLSARTH